MAVGICSKCGKEKYLISPRESLCTKCYKRRWQRTKYLGDANYAKRMRLQGSKALYEFKLKCITAYGERKCARCGNSTLPLCCYAFHHKDGFANLEKKLNVLAPSSRLLDFDIVKEEIKKCDLLCANCHKIVHATNVIEIEEMRLEVIQ